MFLKVLSGLKSLWHHTNTPEQSKISKSAHYSDWAIHMMFIYKITKVNFCISLRKYYEVTLAENDTAAYTGHVHDPIESLSTQNFTNQS